MKTPHPFPGHFFAILLTAASEDRVICAAGWERSYLSSRVKRAKKNPPLLKSEGKMKEMGADEEGRGKEKEKLTARNYTPHAKEPGDGNRSDCRRPCTRRLKNHQACGKGGLDRCCRRGRGRRGSGVGIWVWRGRRVWFSVNAGGQERSSEQDKICVWLEGEKCFEKKNVWRDGWFCSPLKILLPDQPAKPSFAQMNATSQTRQTVPFAVGRELDFGVAGDTCATDVASVVLTHRR